ncbi:MAG TPA: preprotein translocase subunit SecY [Candidatus Binataceae bacterium]|jgi:preprotein translocase subunit SecY|nr:preprotein translocase subunit SecY [Candidatus Binataceae bacterium]HTJ09691.1 preprotein translocase subunit SecY [Candidatus Binataceae bacterium]
MLEGFSNASRIPELRRRLWFTAVMLVVYRAGVAVPTPGIDGQALAAFFDAASSTLFGWVNLFSGGALERFSVFALGIMPYISVAIILDLLKVAWPYLDELYKEGEAGRRKISQYTRYGTVLLSVVQGFMIAVSLEHIQAPGGGSVVYAPGWSFRIITVLTVTAGSMFVMWIGEQVTERGIGNGISLIIMAGIVARLPSALSTTFQFVREGEMSLFVLIIILLIVVGVTGFIVYVETSQRRIPIQYARRVVGRRVYGGQSSHLPLKINTAGVIPPIFASSILVFPATVATFLPAAKNYSALLTPGGWVYDVVYVALIVFFCYFYTAVTFNPVDVADNLKKYGGFIPGIRPGRTTAAYIDRVLSRITLFGAIYVSIICVLPTLLIQRFNVPFYFGGTALLIVVGVALDTVAQMQTHLLTRNYEGFMGRGRIKSPRGR